MMPFISYDPRSPDIKYLDLTVSSLFKETLPDCISNDLHAGTAIDRCRSVQTADSARLMHTRLAHHGVSSKNAA
jgi:hypothetical protein